MLLGVDWKEELKYYCLAMLSFDVVEKCLSEYYVTDENMDSSSVLFNLMAWICKGFQAVSSNGQTVPA